MATASGYDWKRGNASMIGVFGSLTQGPNPNGLTGKNTGLDENTEALP